MLPAIKYENNSRSESRLSRAFYFKIGRTVGLYAGVFVANYDNASRLSALSKKRPKHRGIGAGGGGGGEKEENSGASLTAAACLAFYKTSSSICPTLFLKTHARDRLREKKGREIAHSLLLPRPVVRA